jgi:hypothetical protein
MGSNEVVAVLDSGDRAFRPLGELDDLLWMHRRTYFGVHIATGKEVFEEAGFE